MKTKKEEMDFRENILDEYEIKVGLPAISSPGEEKELQEYLTMSRDVIEKITPDRSRSIAIRLSQFSFYIQRLSNREHGRVTWAKNELNLIVAKSLGDIDKYTKAEHKVALIIQENSAAKALNDILIYAQQRVDRLNELANGIKSLSYVISLGYKHKVDNKYE